MGATYVVDIVTSISETYQDVLARSSARLAPKRRKVRRGDKMAKFLDKLDPTARVKTSEAPHAR